MLRRVINTVLNKMAFAAPGGKSLRPWLQRRRGVKIGKNVWISQLVFIDEDQPENLTIGENSTIGLRTSIFTHLYWDLEKDQYNGEVVIERNVYVGPHCVIHPNVRIGEGAVIKAGTVVTRDVPPHTFWGAPQAEALGRVTVPLTPEHSYEHFVKGLQPIRKNRK